LARKLGIKPESRLLLVGAPPGFEVPNLPPGVTVHTRPAGSAYDVIVAFCPDKKRLIQRANALPVRLTRAGALWIAWPKKASGVVTDIGEKDVHAVGLATGLVDVKVAAIDPTWAGFKFVRRLRDR
jgi:hypothetical protein